MGKKGERESVDEKRDEGRVWVGRKRGRGREEERRGHDGLTFLL